MAGFCPTSSELRRNEARVTGSSSAGLCSVTLRRLPVDRVVQVLVDAGLTCVEWGGDIHVPPGDPAAAANARQRCAEHGVRIASYGSYWRADGLDAFEPVLAAACALGAPRIRIWAGQVGSAEADAPHWRSVVEATRAAADRAADAGVELSYEYHGNTLTDTAASTLRLLDEVDRPNVRTYWQPRVGMPDAEVVHDLRSVLPRVTAVHVYSWWPGEHRLPLAGRADLWRTLLPLVDGKDTLLEFVVDDDPAQLVADAATLARW
jgi:3-dehydroshikimate dehydratase